MRSRTENRIKREKRTSKILPEDAKGHFVETKNTANLVQLTLITYCDSSI